MSHTKLACCHASIDHAIERVLEFVTRLRDSCAVCGFKAAHLARSDEGQLASVSVVQR
jgi:hypothetical protein